MAPAAYGLQKFMRMHAYTAESDSDHSDESEEEEETRKARLAQQFAAGEHVVCRRTFKSDSKGKIRLWKGTAGKIQEIDEFGDAYIDFETAGLQWVFSSKFQYLDKNKQSVELDEESKGKLIVGQRVEVRDRESDSWEVGVVRSLRPLKVKAKGMEIAYEWKEVRALQKFEDTRKQTKSEGASLVGAFLRFAGVDVDNGCCCVGGRAGHPMKNGGA